MPGAVLDASHALILMFARPVQSTRYYLCEEAGARGEEGFAKTILNSSFSTVQCGLCNN